MAFNKHKNMLKGISNVVEATSKEEQIHGDFGIDLIKIIKTKILNGLILNMNLKYKICAKLHMKQKALS